MEQETKKCPFCGEIILAIAQKCKYCGEWLNRKTLCPFCGEQIEENSIKCPHCDENLNKELQPSVHSTIRVDVKKGKEDNHIKEIVKIPTIKIKERESHQAKGTVTEPTTRVDVSQLIAVEKQKQKNKKAKYLFFSELIAFSFMFPISQQWSWWIGFILFAVGCVLLQSQILRIIYSLAMSFMIGATMYALLLMLLATKYQTFLQEYQIVSTIIMGVIALSWHVPIMNSNFMENITKDS
ncbi:MAG: zinc ribbon domain-containing protein [Prevotellaceae bacterium]|jgi:ribosomal protein L32|nr:zinc ribbon domain-containing protein [Prevotellaceae bacterium]